MLVYAMATIEEITKKLVQNHVISFQNENNEWAGYSPSNGLFWVNGENFQTATAAATAMAQLGEWKEIDQCIDDDWTCPGEDAGHCTETERGEHEGPCDQCPARRAVM